MKKSKRLLSLVLAILMVISAFSGANLSAMANFTLPENQVLAGGQCGENAYYTYDDLNKTLSIAGTGTTMNVDAISQSADIQTVNIMTGITGIGDGMFENCTSLKSVYVPLTVNTIGKNAFVNNQLSMTFTYEGGVADYNEIAIADGNFNVPPDYIFIGKIEPTIYRNEWVFNSYWYYFDDNARIVANSWITDSTGWCYLQNDATMAKSKWIDDGTGKFCMDKYGHLITDSWLQDINGWHYVNGSGRMVTYCWAQDSQGWCYLDSNGDLATQTWVQDSIGWCYLGKDGHIVTSSWVAGNNKGWYYVDSNGYLVSDSWVMDSVGWCYLGSNGSMLTNAWAVDSLGWCYLDNDGHLTTNKWVEDYYGWCYLDDTGHLLTNSWAMDSWGWCHLDSNGYLITNSWTYDSIDWVYVDGEGHMVKDTWMTDATGWCYLDSNGYITRSNWLYYNDNWFAFDSDGHMVTGWFYNGANWYYFDGAGHMLTGWQNIDGTDYYFNESGAWEDPNAPRALTAEEKQWILDNYFKRYPEFGAVPEFEIVEIDSTNGCDQHLSLNQNNYKQTIYSMMDGGDRSILAYEAKKCSAVLYYFEDTSEGTILHYRAGK